MHFHSEKRQKNKSQFSIGDEENWLLLTGSGYQPRRLYSMDFLPDELLGKSQLMMYLFKTCAAQ